MNTPPVPTLPGTRLPRMELLRFTSEHLDAVGAWMTPPGVRCWLDFGNGRQELSRRELFLLLTSPRVYARLFRLPGEGAPLGLVCLNNIDDQMGAMEVWVVRDGTVRRTVRNDVAGAIIGVMASGFLDHGRQVANSWVVASNRASIYLHNVVGMRRSGVQRSRHVVDGQRQDRWTYDMTLADFGELYPDVVSEQGRTFRGLQAAPTPALPSTHGAPEAAHD
ncbi:GNAT family N-acetyltransferase [Myxococcus sp. K15C18031901]|uniref:GNAT family protein n=1 Tax=Myxococcus dinghuensis TaxID=2906761 RepID=UPI0020A6E45E|nr:GNAT family protein [Myxococcus dinghuensis]MCP3102881.1 GNAT family N-acetyltransferase [Myxococcus dinghuensis]